jgi:hypothetical protein
MKSVTYHVEDRRADNILKWMQWAMAVAAMITIVMLISLFTSTSVSAREIGPTEQGRFRSEGVTPEGYPMFLVWCSQDQCVGPHGAPIGNEQQLSQQLPEVRPADIQREGYRCNPNLCTYRGAIIGRPSRNYRPVQYNRHYQPNPF